MLSIQLLNEKDKERKKENELKIEWKRSNVRGIVKTLFLVVDSLYFDISLFFMEIFGKLNKRKNFFYKYPRRILFWMKNKKEGKNEIQHSNNNTKIKIKNVEENIIS